MADELTAGGVPVYRDSAGTLREARGQPQIDALAATIATKADATAIPLPATATPKSEMTGGNKGSVTRYALEDHQHPRLTSTTYATLASDGTATLAFSRTFANKPGVVMTEVDAAGKQPLVCSVQSWVQDGDGRYTGCIIRGQRAQMLPTINPLAGTIALLTGVISGVNTLVSALTGYNVFGGGVVGASVSVIAVARSDVSAA